MAERFTKPYLIDGAGHGQPLERIEYETPPYTESEVQGILRQHPELLAIDQLDPIFAPAVCIGREVRTDGGGNIDNLYVSPSGYVTIVETKLWKNPQARREVVAQILEYAKELSRWTHQRLEEVLRGYLRQHEPEAKVRSLAEWVAEETDESINEKEFSDALARCLRGGKFLLLIVGEGIRENIEDLVHHLAQTPGLGYSLALIELGCYRLSPKDGRILIVPRVIGRTAEVERAIVTIDVTGLTGQRPTVRVTPSAIDPERARSVRERLTEKDFFDGLRGILGEAVAEPFFMFLETLRKLGIERDYKSANVSLRYLPAHDGGTALSVLSVARGQVTFGQGSGSKGNLKRTDSPRTGPCTSGQGSRR